MMKTNLSSLLFLFLLLLLSCSDDDKYEPISLAYPERNAIFDNEARRLNLSPYDESRSLLIKGGDGSYDLINTDEAIVSVHVENGTITFSPLSLGSATITIKDRSQNSYELSVTVKYPTTTYSVFIHHAVVEGNDITVGDKAKLEEEILESMPVDIKGKYMFTFTNRESREGEVAIHKSQSGSDILKGTFQYKRKETEDSYPQMIIQVGDKELIYDFTKYSEPNLRSAVSLRSDHFPPMMLVEDVTDKYKSKYPALEKANAIQGLMFMRE